MDDYLIPSRFCSDERAKNLYAHMKGITGDAFDFSALSYHDKSALLSDMENLCLIIRRLMSSESHDVISNRKASPFGNAERLPVTSVSISFRDGLLSISIPNTFVRTSSESWYLSTIVRNEIREYEAANGPVSATLRKPVYFIVKRKDVLLSGSYRDNDNLEVKKLVDSVCMSLGFSDSPSNMGYVSLYETVSDAGLAGTDIFIFNKNDLGKFWGYLSF